MDRVWALWLDWCEATGRDPANLPPETTARFLAQVAGARHDLLHRAARRAGVEPAPRQDPWEAQEARWVPLSRALGRCAVYGWPGAVPGRRDAWLLVLTRHLRLSRANAVTQYAHSVPAVIERLPEHPVDGTCLRCVVARWLEVVATQALWSRTSVRQVVWPRPGQPSGSAARHCDGTCGRIDDLVADIPGRTVMAPAIDCHGWWADWRPMSLRSVTAVLGARNLPLTDEPLLDEVIPNPVVADDDGDREPAFDEHTLDRLDAAMARADEVNARLEALLREYG